MYTAALIAARYGRIPILQHLIVDHGVSAVAPAVAFVCVKCAVPSFATSAAPCRKHNGSFSVVPLLHAAAVSGSVEMGQLLASLGALDLDTQPVRACRPQLAPIFATVRCALLRVRVVLYF